MAQIPRFPFDSSDAKSFIAAGLPVVLSGGCPLAANATDWSFDYLSNIMAPQFRADVYVSRSKRFMYFDEGKNALSYQFTPPTEKQQMPMQQFASIIRDPSLGDPSSHYYLQSSVVTEMGPAMIQEYSTKFSLDYALMYKMIGQWDALTTNLLL
jgi:hypothetical protein